MVQWVVALTIVFGWILPFSLGVAYLRRGSGPGTGLSILGGLWGLGIMVLASLVINSLESATLGANSMRLCVWLGWTVPVAAGLIWRRRALGGASALLALGGLWAILGIGFIANSVYRSVTGPPYAAQLQILSQGPGQVSMELKIQGHNGKQYSASRFCDTEHPPRVLLLSRNGKRLWESPMTPG